MPKCAPLGNADMKMIATAKKAVKKATPDSDTMRRRIKSLQDLCGYTNQELFGSAIGIDARRLRTIADNPATCKLEEAVLLQTLASQLGATMFDTVTLAVSV